MTGTPAARRNGAAAGGSEQGWGQMPRSMTGTLRRIMLAVLAIGAAGAGTAQAAAPPYRLALELEAGPAWQSYNDVQIPNNDTATRFSLSDAVGKGPWAAGRVYLTWHLSEASDLRALYAPLTINEPGELAGPVSFAGGDFNAGQALATFKFNSYRLTYRHRFHEGERWSWWWGGTAKIRDARIALEQDGVIAAKDDLGFVPLLHISGEWRPAAAWRVTFDADALAGGPGRAEDVALKLSRDLGEQVRLAVGYRLVEGGADVDEVYTFTWLHYAVASVRVDF